MSNSYRPEPPQLLPTTIADGRAPGVYYRIDGELVPVLHIWLDGSVPVFFELHVVLWKDPALAIGVKGKGALKRMIAGMQLLLTEARGPGQVAFSRDESVRMDPQVYGLKTGIFGGTGNLIFNRFTGPGRVGIQSMYMDMSTDSDR
jgi:uncharacterized protein (AIM24 family)